MQDKSAFWHKVVGEEWYNFFPELWDSDYMEKLLTHISHRYQSATVYPEMSNLFRAFKQCPFNKLKVVIISNSNYDESSKGLLFDDVERIVLKQSSRIIMETVERECYDGFKLSYDFGLQNWANQGVLLLNTSLTYEKFGEDHTKYWRNFIDAIIKKLNDVNGLHVCLWGDKAKSFKSNLDPKKVHIYEEVHPLDTLVDWDCDHFSEINKSINNQNGKEEIIVW